MQQPAEQRSSVAVVGLGYVGLPLAQAFARHMPVVGIDINAARVDELSRLLDGSDLAVTSDFAAVAHKDFVIIAVPTPVTKSKEPDLGPVRAAATSVASHLTPGTVVILESTVFPGVTEEVVVPLLEKGSGLTLGEGFGMAYCPERINPGDDEHTIERTTKVVSGNDEQTANRVQWLYGLIAGSVFRAPSIATAEASKVIENVQRDLNIALVNELAIIFARMGLDTEQVLSAAATKWNFHRYHPGLVGGHCIPVDPYYLIYRARELGYHAQVIAAGRSINDSMPKYVAEMTVKALNRSGKVIRDSRVLIMGLSYKENIADTRESPSYHLADELRDYGIDLYAHDPCVSAEEAPVGVTVVHSLADVEDMDAIIVAVGHDEYLAMSVDDLRRMSSGDPVLVDIRRLYSRKDAEAVGFYYRTL